MCPSIDQGRLEQFSSLEFFARQVVEGFITGLHKSPFHGFSVEFAEHRLYNTGESVRNIDWKLYGRSDRLFTKRYEEETNLRCQILIDHSSSMCFPVLDHADIDHPDKITFAVYTAAVLIHLFRRQRDASGISVFSDRIDLHTHSKSSQIHLKYLYQELEKLLIPFALERKKQTAAASALHELAERIHQRSLVIIFSDMFENTAQADDVFSALQHLRHNKHEVILFHVVDKSKEIEFDFANRPSKFIDMETGQHLKIHPSQLRARYVEAIEKYKRELFLRCGQYQIDFVETDINSGFEQVLMPFLMKRSRLF